MLDRLLLWTVVLLPVFTVVGAVLHARWKRQSPARRTREMLSLGIASTLAIGVGLIFVFRTEQNAATSRHVHFQNPLTLLWLMPLYLGILLIQWRTLAGLNPGRKWLAFLFRSAILILLVLALAGLQMVVEKDLLSVLYILDRSKSVPVGEAQKALEWINTTLPEKPADDKVGLLVFGGKVATEVWPSATFHAPNVKNIKAEVAPDQTNIAEALRRAASTFEEGAARRLVLFTDGSETHGEALKEIKDLASKGVSIWIVPLSRSDTAEMLIEEVKAPPDVQWEQPFDVRVKVQANITTKARLRLFTGDRVGPSAFEKTVDLEPGPNLFTFKDMVLRSGGPHQIEALLEPLFQRDDTLKENNRAYTFTDVQTDSRILILTSDLGEVEFLRRALEGEKIALDVRSGATLPSNPEEYRRYDCIVLANLGRSMFSESQMAVIESCVKDQGAGLVMIGGDQSFGAGGYLGTPIERALPVSMDLQNQRIMPSGALGLVLHTCEFADGNAWGKKIAKAAINTLSPQDYAGLLYFGGPWGPGGEKWLFTPTKVSRKPWMFAQIDTCEPGDMPNLDSIVGMAVTSLSNLANVSLKHVIVITDGDPSPPTAATIGAAKAGKVTITIITIFPHGGGDISTMKEVAKQTGGRYYSADDPRKLPQIFIKEAAVVRKNLIHQDERGIPLEIGSKGELLRDFGNEYPKVDAFVVTEPKERAELHLYAIKEGEKCPVLARWHYGLGKSVAFTSDATNRWGKRWVSWPSYKKYWSNIIHWVSRKRMPTNYVVRMPTRKGEMQKVIVEGFDKQGQLKNFSRLIGTANEPGVGENMDAQSHGLSFTQTAPGQYEAEFPVKAHGAYTITVIDMSDPANPSSFVTGMANSYSAEFKQLEVDFKALQAFSEAAGENSLKDLATLAKAPNTSHPFAHDLPPTLNPTDFFWPLVLAALCLFPLDVALRRLHVDPLVAWGWLGEKLAPVVVFIKSKGGVVADAAAAVVQAGPQAPPVPLMPSGADSRAAQSRYEQAGTSDAAQGVDFNPLPLEAQQPKAVGGAKLTPVDAAASDYTRALLKAKRKAKKE